MEVAKAAAGFRCVLGTWIKSRVLFLTLVIAAWGLCGAACALDLAEVESNRALWESRHITDYDFVLGRSCFCDPAYTRPGLVTVRMNSVVAAVDSITHEPRRLGDFFTMDGVFDSLRDSLQFQPATIVTAEFDLHLGYPRRFRFDDPGLFDDDITYGILALTVVPEPTALMLAVFILPLLAWRRVHVFGRNSKPVSMRG
jgi:hypothetical protein